MIKQLYHEIFIKSTSAIQSSSTLPYLEKRLALQGSRTFDELQKMLGELMKLAE
jgi:hypothetical protein